MTPGADVVPLNLTRSGWLPLFARSLSGERTEQNNLHYGGIALSSFARSRVWR